MGRNDTRRARTLSVPARSASGGTHALSRCPFITTAMRRHGSYHREAFSGPGVGTRGLGCASGFATASRVAASGTATAMYQSKAAGKYSLKTFCMP